MSLYAICLNNKNLELRFLFKNIKKVSVFFPQNRSSRNNNTFLGHFQNVHLFGMGRPMRTELETVKIGPKMLKML